MKIHPAADLFPMMSDEELQDLAADIAANGLQRPITIDAQNQLIDGRNRLAACKLAKVEPKFEQLNGHDPLAFIVSANLARRNLTKGQQAMALAMIYPEPEKGGRGKNKERVEETSTVFSAKRLQQARSVLRHSRPLAESVIKGATSLDEALREVDKARAQASTAEGKLERLQLSAPDLAARVTEENLNLDEAIAIVNQREIDLRRTREIGRDSERRILEFVGYVTSIFSARAAGENIRIGPDRIKTLQKAFELLLKMESEP